MSDLSFVAGEFQRLASTALEAAEAVRSARPEGGASAFASAMPGTSLDEHAESLLAAERDFIAAEEANSQLIGSILEGHSYGAGAGAGSSIGEVLSGHSYGASSAGSQTGDVDDMVTSGSPGGEGRGGLGPGNKDWIEKNPITGTAPHAKIPELVKDFVNDAVEGVTETVRGVGEEQE